MSHFRWTAWRQLNSLIGIPFARGNRGPEKTVTGFHIRFLSRVFSSPLSSRDLFSRHVFPRAGMARGKCDDEKGNAAPRVRTLPNPLTVRHCGSPSIIRRSPSATTIPGVGWTQLLDAADRATRLLWPPEAVFMRWMTHLAPSASASLPDRTRKLRALAPDPRLDSEAVGAKKTKKKPFAGFSPKVRTSYKIHDVRRRHDNRRRQASRLLEICLLGTRFEGEFFPWPIWPLYCRDWL